MKYLADLHIHSHFSIATSKELVPEHLDLWGRIKGITVVGTGDFTHPGWTQELREKLEPAESGLFQLKPSFRLDAGPIHPNTPNGHIRFALSAEISTIYKKGDKTRKVHHLILAPGFDAVEKIQVKLGQIGNITSDGRPILGLDSRNLLEIVMEADENCLFVPAHIWTPWFSAMGDKSGFDSIDECYGDMSQYIHAIETGLSSDPAMNWRCSSLDRFTIISNSDAHSPQKLGREANCLDTELSYDAMTGAIQTGDPSQFLGTLEFFPEEGKYHHDGHRKCNVSWDPIETHKQNSLCPVCGKRVTVGVLNRVAQLADREDVTERPNRHPFHSMIPLKEVLSEILNVGPNSKKVAAHYDQLIEKLGSEFDVLLTRDMDDLRHAGGDLLAEGMRRMRSGEVHVQAGYDGEFGVIKVFTEQEKQALCKQTVLFDNAAAAPEPTPPIPIETVSPRPSKRILKKKVTADLEVLRPAPWQADNPLADLNKDQCLAAEHVHGPALILAGPGTGKTRVLTCRIVHLIKQHAIRPDQILAVTFTHKAAQEMRQRLVPMLRPQQGQAVTLQTFHALGYMILKEQIHDRLTLIDPDDKIQLLKDLGCDTREVHPISQAISDAKQQLTLPQQVQDEDLGPLYWDYQNALSDQDLLDLDDLIFRATRLLMENEDVARHYRARFPWIMVDEYQDVNFAQYRMIRMLAPAPSDNLYVIGDPNQAIYGFRGADVRFIERFLEDWPEARQYSLSTSYRCSDHILRASHQIVHTENQTPSPLLQGLQSGVKLRMTEQRSDKAEAEFVARTIEQMIGGLRFYSMDSGISQGHAHDKIQSLSDFAVLCRTSAQMDVLEEAFHHHSIPCQTRTQEPFFRQAPIKSILDCLRLAIAPENRFLKQRLLDAKILKHTDLDDLMLPPESPARDALSGLINHLFIRDAIDHAHVIRELLALAEQQDQSAEEFLRFTQTAQSVDAYRHYVEQVTLMTLHASKGLEFPCVFIVGCEDGLLPYHLYEGQSANEAEERRLLYVGMTRAQHLLYLTWAKSRIVHGRKYKLPKSPFLMTIEEELTEQARTDYKKHTRKQDPQLRLFD
ncbi:MAG: UvrD-helicase domain-containing protein [Phycisphaerae bacterium]|nr:UvrD-helicase domain-containing protein [Phycisphaerae bacterium]